MVACLMFGVSLLVGVGAFQRPGASQLLPTGRVASQVGSRFVPESGAVAWSRRSPSKVVVSANDGEGESKLPWFVDPGTYGGVIVLTLVALAVPYGLYAALVQSGMDSDQVGVFISGVFVIGGMLLWAFSYIFRVFSKDMTYSTQLKQYEDAVIQKRYEELQDDEVEALMSEIEREEGLEI